MRRIVVNTCLVLVLVAISWLCFTTGKAYKVILENVPYAANGESFAPLEAVEVTIDEQKAAIFMLPDDRMVGTAVGNTHTMRLDLLDERDNVIESRTVSFNIHELGDKLSINIPRAWATGGI